MTSIPADPTITLGNIVSLEKLDQLMKIADAQKPTNLANDRLNSLILSTYKIDMIEKQMVNMKIPRSSIRAIRKEKTKLKVEMAESAIELAQATIQTESDVRALKADFAQNQISFSVESPINWESSSVKSVPISYDSLKFDVQFFQFMKADDKQSAESSDATKSKTVNKSRGTTDDDDEGGDSEAHASTLSSYVSDTLTGFGEPSTGTHGSSHMESSHSTSTKASTTNNIEGTVVIVAKCTHKGADVMAPCILDARKSVAAWNYYYPDDYLFTDAINMFEASGIGKTSKPDPDQPLLHLLSGVSRGSSFVGYAHVLKKESTTSSTTSSSTVSSVAESIQQDMFVASLQGSFASNQSKSSTASNLLSKSTLEASCSLTCEGVIPSIVANDVVQMVQKLDPDPAKVMGQLDAIAQTSSAAVAGGNTSIEAGAGDAANGAKFMELNSEHLKNSATVLGNQNDASNKIININTMMEAFKDYVDKAAGGGVGVPINYFIKELNKQEIAKVYIRKFFPNGAKNQKDAMAGATGGAVEGGTDTQ